MNKPTDSSNTKTEMDKQITETIPVIIKTCKGLLIASLTVISFSTTIKYFLSARNLKNMKVEKKSIGIILTSLLFLSSSFYYLLRGFPTEKLPSERILRELSEDEKNTIIRKGFTLIMLYCNNCSEVENFLENLIQTKGFEEIYLYIPKSNQSENFIIVSNYRYLEKISNLTTNNLKGNICKFMINPPIECWV